MSGEKVDVKERSYIRMGEFYEEYKPLTEYEKETLHKVQEITDKYDKKEKHAFVYYLKLTLEGYK